MHAVTSTSAVTARAKVRPPRPAAPPRGSPPRADARSRHPSSRVSRRASLAPLPRRPSNQVRAETSRPKSARRTAVVAAASKDSKAAPEEESNFWKKVFLKEGEEEVSSSDYQKFQAELAAKKAENAKKAAEKDGSCVIM